jgi:hypothetical protein
MSNKKKPKLPIEKQVHDIVAKIIKEREQADQMPPGWIARQALIKIGQPKSPLVSYCAIEHLKQIARACLRVLFEPEDERPGTSTPDLFIEFQSHYPLPHEKDEEPTYWAFEYLSPEQLRWNAERLRAEARAKNAHADALDAEADKREAIRFA